VRRDWLARFNPTLQGVVSLQSSAVDVQVSTPDRLLPAQQVVVDVSAIRSRAAAGPSLQRLAINLKNQVAFLGQGASLGGEGPTSEVWLGPMRVRCHADGAFELSRLDMRVGGGESALHVAVWGTGNTYTQQ